VSDQARFRAARVGATSLVAVPALFDALASRLRAHATLYAWAEAEPQPRALQGRGVVYVAAVRECDTTVVVRHAWHGGLLAPLTGDRFLLPTRAPREAAVSLTLRERGIHTPEVLAYALYPAGPGMRRVDVCTRYVRDSWDFGALLDGSVPTIARGDGERAVIALLVQLAKAGVVHPDLNVKNLLLVLQPDHAPAAWLLDVDVVQFHSAPAPQLMHRNLQRLVRSIHKWHQRQERAIDASWLAHFMSSALAALA
jgi:tRNA A-37 threonylcarbamoyl transferase component Bud32